MKLFRKSTIFGAMILVFFTGIFTGNIHAQTWTTYTNTDFVSGMAANGDEFWAATNGGALDWSISAGTYVKYTVSEGLADQWVKDVMIDNTGDTWFGTTEGVQHYDGVTWTTYNMSNSPLPSDVVYSIAQDLNSDMWFGTSYGCAKFDGVAWDVFTDLGGGATNVAVRGIGVDSLNQIWTANNPQNYGDPGGVSMYNGTTWTRYDPDPGNIGQYMLSLAVDDNNNVWAGTWTNWIFMYNGSTWTHYDSGNSGLVGTGIEVITVDAGNDVWIGNHMPSYSATTNGLTNFDGSVWTTYTTADSGLPASFLYAISTSGSNVYLGTAAHGSATFDGISWSYFKASNEPHSNWINCIDKGIVGLNPEGLYFGTEYYGVAVLINDVWSSYNSNNSGLGDDYVNDVLIHDNTLWVGCQYLGLWKYNGVSWTNYNAGNSGLLGDMIISIDTDSSGTLWLGTSGWSGPLGQDGAVAKFDGSTWTNYYLENSGLIDDDGLRIKVDSNDIIWIGTEEGISKFDGVSTWTNYHSGNSGLINNHVQAITFDLSGGTWFGTWSGISHIDSSEIWTSYTVADGLPGNDVLDLLTTNSGAIWAATDAGAAVYEAGIWTAYTQDDGLADNDLTSLAVDSYDLLWFGTDRSGISSLDPTSTDIPTISPRGICLIIFIISIIMISEVFRSTRTSRT